MAAVFFFARRPQLIAYDESGGALRGNYRLAALLLAVRSVTAQHAGVRAGPGIGGGHSDGRVEAGIVSRLINHRTAHLRLAPYSALDSDAGYADGYLPEPDYFPISDSGPGQSGPPTTIRPSPPGGMAHSSIQNYHWDHANAVGQTDFTIVLKDGSIRSAIATWVQGGMLHYTDSEDRHAVLSSGQLDREATRRMNKGLVFQLPPN